MDAGSVAKRPCAGSSVRTRVLASRSKEISNSAISRGTTLAIRSPHQTSRRTRGGVCSFGSVVHQSTTDPLSIFWLEGKMGLRTLAEVRPLGEASSKVVQWIGETMSWDIGGLWYVDAVRGA